MSTSRRSTRAGTRLTPRQTLLLIAVLLVIWVGRQLTRPEPAEPPVIGESTATAVAATSTVAPATAAPTATPKVTRQAAPLPAASQEPVTGLREIIVLHTNDEHGYLLPTENQKSWRGGAGYAAAIWLANGHNPHDPATNTLLLSGGDSWTGPAISTWFEGEPVVEVMNALGYRATVIGNHEFDFGRDVLIKRIGQAQYPYLAANLYREGTTETPDWVQPYLLTEVNGVTVGIIGLAYENTPSVTSTLNLTGLEFGDYAPALEHWVPVVREQGAEVLVVLSHIPGQDLVVLAEQVKELDIALFLGGHDHRTRTSASGGALVATSGGSWEDYIQVRLVYDPATQQVVESEQETISVAVNKSDDSRTPPAEVSAILDKWAERVDVVLGEVIGYTAKGIDRRSAEMHNLLVDSWLWAYPSATVAMSNTGGFRAGIDQGEITVGDVVGVFPFDNSLLALDVTGEQLQAVLQKAGDAIVVGGVRQKGNKITLKDGTPLKPDGVYQLLVTDYMYYSDDYPFQKYDPEPYETSILWRQPVIDWIKAQHSTEAQPIEALIDDAAWSQN
ncbi:MAG: bifunctional metallophosphatase/5'-nucleotidase [Chloroflexi bacterium]|jgi:5'-nucleotidase/UDP-sugar diphosphatase|nr:bifunctional metallophosphatase/5'-nucleotidase [Chloroflexota bacterium]